jgi:hypothetical protein
LVPKAEQAGSKDENGLHLSPPPSRGEGKGGGEYSDPVPLTFTLLDKFSINPVSLKVALSNRVNPLPPRGEEVNCGVVF